MAELDNLSIKITSSAEDASAVIDKLIKNVRSLRRAIKSLDNIANGNTGATAAAKNVSKAMDATQSGAKKATSGMKQVQAEAKKASESLGKVAQKTIAPKVDTSDIEKAQKEAKELHDIAGAQIGNRAKFPVAKPNVQKPATPLESDAEYMARFKRWLDERNVNMQYDLGLIDREQYRDARINMGATRAPVSSRNPADQARVDRLRGDREGMVKASDAIAALYERENSSAEATTNLSEASSKATSTLSSMKGVLASVSGALTKHAGDLAYSQARSEAFVGAIKSVSIKAFTVALRGAAVALKTLGAFAKVAGAGITSLARKILAFPAKQLRNAFNIATLGAFGKATQSARNAAGAFQQMAGGVALGLRNIMRYVLGFRTLFYLVRAIRQGIAEGFKNLAAENEQVNQSLSILQGRLTQVKNGLASAFAPLVNYIAEPMSKFIGILMDGINAIAQFFAALTGASTWQRATYTMGSFTSGASAAGDAADGANKSAKELQKTLLGFDKINRLNDDDNGSGSGGSGGGGGGGGGGASGGMFTTETVSTGISNFAQMVKDAWANADFTDVGKVVGEKLAAALNNIPWETIQTTGEKFGKSFATFINGLVSVTELAKALGSTVGEAINTLFQTGNQFVNNLKFDAIGEFIATAMNTGIGTIKWGTIANTIAGGVNGYFAGVGAWAGLFNFGSLGTAIANTITATLTQITWPDAEKALSSVASGIATAMNKVMTPSTFSAVGTAIAGGINSAVSSAKSFVGAIDWSGWGSAVAAGVNKFFKDVHWGDLGVSFSTAVSGLLDLLANAIEGINWDTVGKSVVDAFGSVKWDELIIKAAKLINVGVNALVELVEAIFKGIAEQIGKWFDEHLPESVKTAIEGATKIKEFVFGDEGTGIAGRTGNEYGDRTATITFSGKTDESYESTKKDVNAFAKDRKPVTTAKGNEKDSTWTSLKKGWAGVQNKTAQVTTGVAGKFSDVKNFFTKWKTLKNGKKNKKTATLNMKVEGSPGKVKEMYNAMTNIPKSKTSTLTVGAEMQKNVTKITRGGKILMDTSLSFAEKDRQLRALGFAKGGSYYGGFWHSIPQYAMGATPVRGSLFIAGEAGAEAVGHINGRTEVLNRSQMASVMYNAVLRGMSAALAQNGGSQTVIIQPDPQGIFRVVQDQANKYTNMTGRPAFNL